MVYYVNLWLCVRAATIPILEFFSFQKRVSFLFTYIRNTLSEIVIAGSEFSSSQWFKREYHFFSHNSLNCLHFSSMQIINIFCITNKSAPLCAYCVIIIKYNTLHVLIKNVYSQLPLCYVSYYIKYKTRTFL